ncbi:MAG: SAP domain-containing protein [Moraxellaceae bacterium]|nr:SAP domain-containing protein [Moraxellaceae bacterium]
MTNQLPTGNDIFIKTDQRFIEIAYKQIVIDGGIEFPPHDKNAFQTLIRDVTHESTYYLVRALFHMMGEQPFKWALHENCLRLCKEYDIYPNNYFFYKSEPKCPHSVTSGLEYLTVAEIKPLLKERGLKVSGKKSELIERLNNQVSFDEIANDCLPKYQEKLADYERKSIMHQYELLISMLVFRTHFLRRKNEIHDRMKKGFFSGKFIIKGIELPVDKKRKEADIKLAKLIDGKGYDDVIINNRISKFLPIYPSGSSFIKTDIIKNK